MSEKKEVPVFQNFEEFWPYYLEQHAQPLNRRLHQLGTSLGVMTALHALRTKKLRYLPLAAVLGYGPAWVGHFFIEKNKPASFDYFLWSFMGDMKMNTLLWAGKLDEELERYGIGDLDAGHTAASQDISGS